MLKFPLFSGISGCFSTLLHDGIMNPAEGKKVML